MDYLFITQDNGSKHRTAQSPDRGLKLTACATSPILIQLANGGDRLRQEP